MSQIKLTNYTDPTKKIAKFPQWTSSQSITDLNNFSSMEEIMNLATQYGFFQPSSQLYGGWAGFFDYGPLGVQLKNNIKLLWWKTMVQEREDVVGCETPIIGNPDIWKASGHTEKFFDPLLICKHSKTSFKIDEFLYASIYNDRDEFIGYLIKPRDIIDTKCISIDEQLNYLSNKTNTKLENIRKFHFLSLEMLPIDEINKLPSPFTGNVGDLIWSTQRSLLYHLPISHQYNKNIEQEIKKNSLNNLNNKSYNKAYLRPETSQGIFINFNSIIRSQSLQIPFGIAQIGKSFRNEITPKYGLYRLKEFEQMEIEYFISPSILWKPIYDYWITQSTNFLINLGIDKNKIKLNVHKPEELAHYAKYCTDILFKFPFGYSEIIGTAFRGSYDLEKHQKFSNQNLTILDPITKKYVLPFVIEPSFGLDRLVLAVFTSSLYKYSMNGSERRILSFNNKIAPIKLAVFPLISNNDLIMKEARLLFKNLLKKYDIIFDSSGSIGKRYRKADEKGIPYCLTIDFLSLTDKTFTIRKRDSAAQSRIDYSQLVNFLESKFT